MGVHIDIWKRFWWKVDPCRTDGCFIWVGSKSPKGYGELFVDRVEGKWRTILAHHFLNGVPLRGLHTDHVRARGCFNKLCVNPEHLEIVTPGENTRRGNAGAIWREKTHCPRGHEYTAENTRLYRGKRFCRKCGNRSQRQRALAKAEGAIPTAENS